MIILLDIGNTSVTYGLCGGGKLRHFGRCQFDSIPKMINNWSRSGRLDKYNDLVISSVVPKKARFLKKTISQIRGINLWIIGENLKVSIPHRYRSLKKLGSDRLINIYGALRLYKPPLLIIDFGTAVTMDYISKKGVFEGGMILPGPEISFQALLQKAARIPKTFRLPKRATTFLGKDTYPCIASGILQGYGAMTDGLVDRFKSRYGKKLRVLATGGFAKEIKPYTRSFQVYDPRHSIKSLFILFKDYQARKAP